MPRKSRKHVAQRSNRIGRRRFVAATGTASIVGLAGCSGGGSKKGDTGSSKSSGNGPTKVTFWSKLSGGDGAVMKEMVKEFNDSHDDIQIDRQRIPTDEYYNKVYTALTGKKAPDLAIMNGGPLYQDQDYFMSLDDHLDKSLLKKYYQVVRQRGAIDGKQCALPLDAAVKPMYYNKGIFKKAGLDPEKPPSNYEEFKHAANQIEKKTDKKAFTAVAYGAYDIHMFFMTILNQVEGSYLDGSKKKVKWDSQKGIEQAKFIRSIPTRGWDSKGLADAKGEKMFRNGELAMLHQGTWFFSTAVDSGVDFGTFNPTIAKGATNSVTWASSNMLAVPRPKTREHSDDEHTKAAVKVAKWLTSRVRWPKEAGHVPAWKPSGKSSELKNSKAWDKQLKMLTKMANNNGFVFEPRVENTSYLDPLVSQLGELYSHNVTAEQALTKSAKKAEKVLAGKGGN